MFVFFNVYLTRKSHQQPNRKNLQTVRRTCITRPPPGTSCSNDSGQGWRLRKWRRRSRLEDRKLIWRFKVKLKFEGGAEGRRWGLDVEENGKVKVESWNSQIGSLNVELKVKSEDWVKGWRSRFKVESHVEEEGQGGMFTSTQSRVEGQNLKVELKIEGYWRLSKMLVELKVKGEGWFKGQMWRSKAELEVIEGG